MTRLTLPESLMLLALDDENGHVVSSSSMALPYALAGALLFELCQRGEATLEEDTVTQWPSTPGDDPLLNLAVARFQKQKTPKVRKVAYWIGELGKDANTVKEQVLDKLVELDAIRREERKFLWVIPYQRYPTEDASIETALRKRLHDAVLNKTGIDLEVYMLLSLIGAAKLEKEVFDKEILKEATDMVKKVLEGDTIGSAVSGVVQAIQSAITASIVAATAAGAAASSS